VRHASHEKTATARCTTTAAIDRAAHVPSAAAGATIATDHDHLSEEMSATETAHVIHEAEAEAEAATTTTTATASMRLGVLAAVHQHPVAPADPTFLPVKAVAVPSSLPAHPKSPSRKKRRQMWK